LPERMCIVTREVMDEDRLLRFVRSPDGDVVPDLARKLPGRGVWVALERAKVAEAAAKGLFSRGFKAQSKATGELAERVGQMLRQQTVQHISLARKAGEAVTGFMKVEEALKRGPVRLLFHAAGSGEDGARKLNRLAGPRTSICGFLTPDDLDLAFGRANVVHAAVADGGLAGRLVLHVARLARYEGFEFPVHGKRAVGSEDE
jgi:predicted RNA-binding protein YlxR (DUF448 family)